MIACAKFVRVLFAISILLSPFLKALKTHQPALLNVLFLIRILEPVNSMHLICVSSIPVSVFDVRTYTFSSDRFCTVQFEQLWMSISSVRCLLASEVPFAVFWRTPLDPPSIVTKLLPWAQLPPPH